MRIQALISILALPALLAWASTSLAAEGRITQWLLAGPFESGKPNEFLEKDVLGDPAGLAPSAGAAAGESKWVAYTTPTGFINVNDKEVPVGTTRAAAFGAFVYVYSPKVQPAKLVLTFSDGLVADLNGKRVFNQPDGGGNVVDGHRADVLLGEGWNRLFVRCAWFARFRATWSFGVRLTSLEDGGLEGVKLSVENPYPQGKIQPPKYSPYVLAYTLEHFGIHRVRLVNISPLDLSDASLIVRGKVGQKLQENKLGTLDAFGQVELNVDTDEVSFQQNWPGAVAEVAYTGGKVQALLSALKVEGAQVVEYQTPCINRMKPWAGGRVKILLLVPGSNRQTIELVQRGDFEWHLVDTSGEPKETEKQLQQELANNRFDCIVAASQSWKKVPAAEQIAAAAEQGSGLVVVAPADLPEAMDKLLGLAGSAAAATQPARAGKLEKGADHPVAAGVPVESLPAMAPAPLKAADGAVVVTKVGQAPAVIAFEQGPRRSVVLNFGRGSLLIWPIQHELFLDNYRLPVWERQWSLVLKAILWAGKKDSGTRLTCSAPQRVERDSLGKVGLSGTVSGPQVPQGRIEVQARARGLAPLGVRITTVSAGGSDNSVYSFALPAGLPAGENELDVRLLTRDGKVLDWATAVVDVQPRGSIGKIAVEPAEKDCFGTGDEISFTVPGKANAEGLSLAGRLLDNHGRCVAERRAAIKQGDFTEKFGFKCEGLLTTVGRFEAELSDKGVAEACGQTIFFVRHEFAWDKYEPVLWLTRAGANWYYDLDYFRMLNDVMWIPNGWSTWYNPDGPHRAQMVNGGLTGLGMESLHFFSMNHNWTNATFEFRRNKFNQTKDIRWLYRTPIDKATGLPVDKPDYSSLPFGNNPQNTFFPLDDPEYQAFTRRKIANQLKGLRRYNPLTYDLMDEGSYTSYARAFDFDFSPVSIAHFRIWLKEQYGQLEALNKEWDTAFKSWEEVMPMHIYQVREHVKGKELPSYAPWVDHRRYNDIVYNKYIQLCSDAARAGGDEDAYVGIGGGQRPNPYGGWDYWLVTNHFTWIENYFDDTTEYIRSFNTAGRRLKACPGADVWWSVKNGNVGFYRWVDYGHIRGDFSLLPRGQDTARQLEEVRGRGFSKLLYKAQATDDPIGIHYSQATIQVSHALGGPGSADQFGNGGPLLAKLGFYNLIEELGYQYKFVSYAQVEQGHLQQANYKLMILPESMALSDKEAAQLKDFVEQGGVLVADRWVGQWTQHGRKREKTVLEETFGIDPKAPADKQLGKGWVIYLAGDWPIQYWTARQGKDVKAFWDKLGEALAKAGIAQPRARMLSLDGQPARRTEIRYFDLGKIRYHVISAEVPGTYRFASTTAGHAYDMRDGRYGGEKGTIDVPITQPFPALVALSPYKIDGVTAKAGAAQVNGGAEVTISAQVQARNPGVHALHFRVYGPDGAERRWYSDTVFGDAGKAELRFKTGLNETPGKWTVKVADLASGAVGEAAFEMR